MVNVKFSLSMPYEGCIGIVPTLTLNGSEWLTSCPGHFTTGKEPRYPLRTRLGGLHSRSVHFGEEKKSLAPCI
jgi:hypothetical protein